MQPDRPDEAGRVVALDTTANLMACPSGRVAGGGFVRTLPHDRLPDLLEKEFLRFWKVAFQTAFAAPVLTALLYLLIFGHAR